MFRSQNEIYLAFDGPIPAEFRRLLATLPASTPGQPTLRIRRKRRRSATADEIAEVMLQRASAAGACTEADLERAGFTKPEISKLADQARAIARQRGLELTEA